MSAVTEKEAAGMWCPQTQWIPGTGVYAGTGCWNRGGQGEDHDRCLGSRCMAWRWTGGDDGYYTHVHPDGTKRCAHNAELVEQAQREGWTPLGYCGRAGRP